MTEPRLTLEQRGRAEEVYGRACEEPERVAFEWVDMHDRIEAALALLTRLRGWGCTCDKAYSGRGLTDPLCVKCNFVADIASELEEALTGGRK